MTDPGCAWKGLSMNRDTSGGAVHGLGKRERSVGTVNHGRAGDEPEPLAHKLPTSLMTFDLSMTFSCLCDSGGGGRWHGDGRAAKRRGLAAVGGMWRALVHQPRSGTSCASSQEV